MVVATQIGEVQLGVRLRVVFERKGDWGIGAPKPNSMTEYLFSPNLG